MLEMAFNLSLANHFISSEMTSRIFDPGRNRRKHHWIEGTVKGACEICEGQFLVLQRESNFSGYILLLRIIVFSLEKRGAFLVAQLVKNPPAICGRPRFDPWVRKFPWRMEQLPTPVFWPGEFQGLFSQGVTKSWTWLIDFHFTSLWREYILMKEYEKAQLT